MSARIPARLKRWQPVLVIWEDAFGTTGPEHADKFVAEYKPAIRRTIGYVFAIQPERIFIAGTDDRDGAPSTEGNIADINVIVRGMIREFLILDER